MTRWTMLPLLVALLPLNAKAVIAAKTPPSSIYGKSAAVIAGKITAVTAAGDNSTFEAAVTTLTGTPVGDAIKVRLENLPAVAARVKEGSPIVLFIGNRAGSSALHLGDTWLFPEQIQGPNFRVTKDLEANLRQSYPGTTSALIQIVGELKARNGKYSMLDEIPEATAKAMFHGGVKDLGKVDATGLTALLAARSADKSQAIYGRSKAGLKRFDVTPTGLAPSTSPAPAAVDLIAVADKYYLTATGELGVDGAKRQLWSDGSAASSAAFGNFGEDAARTYVIVIKDDNVLRYPVDGTGEPADFLRMTGERVTTYHKDDPKWLAGATAAALDVNGDGKVDLLINTAAGPMLLINRGYGAFFVDADVAKILRPAGGQPLIPDKALWTAADLNADGLDDLLIVSETGAVTAVMNAKPEAK